MKLELKHLAPYLPYGLRYSFNNHEYWKITHVDPTSPKYDFGEMVRLTVSGENNIGVKWDDEKSGTSSHFSLDNRYFKPILRPMSDLNSRYGEDIISEHSINMLIGNNGNYGDLTVSQWKDGFDVEIDLGYDAPLTKSVDFKIMMMIMEELYKGHFDVFGLIPAGLAIDINELGKVVANG